MEIKIAENIRAFRKARKLTQEQLAEALRVSVGAVSKWELGSSIPDISMIMELADFFETSVDVLLGYEWRSHSVGETVERLRNLRYEKKLEEGMTEAEKALKKYPNAFDVVYQSAMLYFVTLQSENAPRAIELYTRALELLDQNTDERVSAASINNDIAMCYQLMDQYDRAIELYRKNNWGGINDPYIGCLLAQRCQKYDEALPYLSYALANMQSNLYRIGIGYCGAYAHTGQQEKALEIILWLLGVTEGLRVPGTVSFMDKADATFWSTCAVLALELHRPEDVRKYLRKAKELARRFDAAPEYSMKNTKYYHGDLTATVSDDIGETALDGVLGQLRNSGCAAELMPIWEEIWNEK